MWFLFESDAGKNMNIFCCLRDEFGRLLHAIDCLFSKIINTCKIASATIVVNIGCCCCDHDHGVDHYFK